MRRTLGNTVQFRGTGLHTGRPSAVAVAPAPAGTGILFRRLDAPGPGIVPARHDAVSGTLRSTCLSNGEGASVATVEHLMAALGGTGVTDALVTVDGPEIPALDGSALPFVRGFARAGFADLPGETRAIRILAPVEVELDGRRARLAPAPGFAMDFTVDFADPAIGTQRRDLALAGSAFTDQLCDSRTFAILSEVESLRRMGLGRGGSLENTVVIDRGRVLNPGGLRYPDEFVRHKMLDAVGDLALAGAPILGRYSGHKAGHALTNMLLGALFARPGAWRYEKADPALIPGVPGALPDLAPAAAEALPPLAV